MTALVALLLLGSTPDLTKISDQLFHHSDVKAAAEALDEYLQRHPDDAEALELAVIAHAARGEDRKVNQLAVRRAALGDARGLPAVLFAWARTHTAHDDVAPLLAATKKLLPKLSVAEAAPLRRVIGDLDRMLGGFDDAVADARLPGQLTDWQIIGPFENEQNLGFEKVYPPEQDVDLKATYPGKVGDVGWRPFTSANWDGTLCLGCTEFPRHWGVAYLATWVHASRQTDAALWGEADGHLKIWVNRRLAVSDHTSRFEAEGQTRTAVRLHAGWNQVLLKVAHEGEDGHAGLRITDLAGAALPGFEVSSAAHEVTTASESERWPKAPGDPILERLSRDETILPGSYFRAWRTFDLGQARAARHAFEILAGRGPRCALCLQGVALSARAEEDQDAALSELGTASDFDPGFSRALVERAVIHRNMGLEDEAEREVKAAMAGSPGDGDPPAVLARARLKRGYHSEAARLAAKADALLPGWGDYVGIRASAALEQGDRAQAESLLRAQIAAIPSDWGNTRELFGVLKGEGRLDDAAQLYRGWLAHHRHASAVRAELAKVLIDAHHDDDALHEIAELKRGDPDDPEANRLEGDICERRGDVSNAVAAYRRALARSPADWVLRDHIDILDPSTEVARSYQVSEAEVRRRALEALPAAYPGANAVILLSEGTVVAHEDGSIRARAHFAVKVFDQAGIDAFLNFTVPREPSLRLELAATIDRNGTVHEVSSIDNGVVHFPVPRDGNTFEIIFTVDSRPRPGTDWWVPIPMQENQPAIEQRAIVVQPKGRTLRTWKRGKLIEEKHDSLAAAEVTLFDARNEPALADEPNRPPPTSFGDMAVVSTFKDWDAVAQIVRATVDDQLAQDTQDPEIKALARNLIGHAKTADQKVAALADYVRREIHYNQADTDIYTWRAHPARRIVETHYGDCKDKATLFEALARNAGLQVEHAVLLVNQVGTTPTEIPTAWFDHVAAYLPRQPGLTHPGLLDLTAHESGIAAVPFMDQSANALVFRPKETGVRFERIPFSAPADTKRELTLKLAFQPSGAAIGSLHGRMSGLAAADFRASYRSSHERANTLDRFADWVLPSAVRAGKETVTGLDEPEKDLDVQLRLVAASLLRQVGDSTVLKLNSLTAELGSWTRQTERHEPLRLGPERESIIHREIVLPKNLTPIAMPDPVHFDDAYFSFDLTAKRLSDHSIAVETRYQQKAAEIPAAQFPAFREAAAELEHLADVDLALRAAGPALGQR